MLSTLASPLRRADTNAAISWGARYFLDVVTPLDCPPLPSYFPSSLSLSGFPGGSVIKKKKKKKICLPMQEVQVQSLDWKDALDREDSMKKEMATHSSVLPGKSHKQRSLAGYIPWGHKRVGHYLATQQELSLSSSLLT